MSSAARRRWDFDTAVAAASAAPAAPTAIAGKKQSARELLASLPVITFTEAAKADPSIGAAFLVFIQSAVPKIGADKFMALAEYDRYKMRTTPYGEYEPVCTEANEKGQARDHKVIVGSQTFRAKQLSPADKARNLFENRRLALISARNVSYVEAYSLKFPARAAEVVKNREVEAGAYGGPANPDCDIAEGYIADAVYSEYKKQVTPYGEYGLACQEGAAAGEAQTLKKLSLSFGFRSQQQTEKQLAKASFELPKHARDDFGMDAHYQEIFFNRFPSAAAAIKPN